MLTRLYIDNFRCFEKFEYRPARKQLILGANGSGKSSLMDALRFVSQCLTSGDRIDKWFGLNRRTRWLSQCEQVFELETTLQQGTYRYRLVLVPSSESGPIVRRETLEMNGNTIFEFNEGYVSLYGLQGHISPDQNHSVLATTGGGPDFGDFKRGLDDVGCFRANPYAMGSRAETADLQAGFDLANFSAWYRHLVRTRPSENEAFLQALRGSLDGFERLSFEEAGENVRILYAIFTRDGKDVNLGFGELSDGQRCLICLYAILHFVIARGGTVIIDEPENFISLREIQPWLMSAADMADDHKGQVLLISHHPELIDQWAPSYGVYFVRDGAGPVHTEPIRKDSDSGLSVSELIARGWERE